MKHLYEFFASYLKDIFTYLDNLPFQLIFAGYCIIIVALYLLSNRVKKQSKN